MRSDNLNISHALKTEAQRLGFLACGIAQADFLEQEALYLERWLKKGAQGKMAYMEKHFDLRTDPRKLLDGCRSVISVLYNYFPKETDTLPNNKIKISKYAYGTDYHYVVKDKLQQLVCYLESLVGTCATRICVDSAPVMDKVWAKRAGLGWIGKHTNLITKGKGSFFFIGEILTDVKLLPDEPTLDYCGTCRRCIDACPTNALQPYEIDASRCISYLTIELKDNIPAEFHAKMEGWIFGCDICQDVCPWNRFALPHQEQLFKPIDALLHFSEQEIMQLSANQYRKKFKNSPLLRVKREKLLDNILVARNEKNG
jgi:epoxyqueuosine reductase